jgi:DNA-binding CsgD family transcriptional regulator
MIEDRDRARHRSILVAEIERAETLEAIDDILLDVQQLFGFVSYTIFNIPTEDECSLAACAFLTSTPHDFFERYDAISGLPRNPVLARLRGAFRPVQLQIDDIGSDLPPELRAEFRRFLTEYGVVTSILFPMPATSGPRRLAGFAGTRGPLSETEVEELHFLVIQIMARIAVLEQKREWSPLALTALERECLTKSARGLEAVEIAADMGLSSRTVQYLTASLCRKLEVASIEHAVAKALRLKLIA